MKRIAFLVITLFFFLKSMAGDGDKFFNIRNGMQIFVMQKNDFVFWTRDHFRNGLLVGVKFPINK